MPQLKEYSLFTEKLAKMREAYNDSVKGINYFKDLAHYYELRLNVTKNMLNLFLEQSSSQGTIDLNKKISQYVAKIEKIQKSLVKNLSDEPDILEKFNLLLVKLVGFEQIDGNPNIEQLNEKYCDLYCLDFYLSASSDAYRAVMRNDDSMAKFAGEIETANDGSMIFCEC